MINYLKTLIGVPIFIIFLSAFINISNCFSQPNYYWIGGSGNWSDINHWATSSGGATTHLQVPTPYDNVFFDQFSFTAPGQTVTINVGNAVCRNMDWTDALYTPTFEGALNLNFRIYGSLTLISEMNFNFLGDIAFEATTTGHSIKTAGHHFNKSIYFYGAGGEWTLLDALSIGYSLEQSSGTIITNDNDISCVFFRSYSSNTRTIDLGASTITISGTNLQAWSVVSNTLNFIAGTSLIRFTSPISPAMLYSNGLVFYDVEFSSPDGFGTIPTSSDNATFNSITFHGHGNIQGDQTIGTLILSENKVYSIEENKTIHILNDLIAVGSCYVPIILKSSATDAAAYISKTAGSISVESVFMKDIHATGGAIFTANNAVDMGNNTGWIMHTVSTQDLYWVGGSGDWGSSANWSYSSGGPGGACVPSPYDNVIFDENSFSATGQTVNINLPHAFCKDMTWTNALFNPTFSSTANQLHINGSLWLTSGMNMNLYGNVIFEAQTPGQIIRTAGNLILCNFIFEGAGGGWLFEDDFTSMEDITVIMGTLNTNNNNVMGKRMRSYGYKPRGMVFGSSVITLTDNSMPWHVQNSNLSFDAGTSLIRFISNDNPVMSHSNNLTFYDVEFTNANGLGEIKLMNNAVFNSLFFAGNGKISGTLSLTGSHTYGTLTFSQGKHYEIGSGSTQTIITAFNALGTCAEPITIKSIVPLNHATFHKNSGNVTTNYLILKDIYTSGGAAFVADNTVDLGNNTGWTINAPSPQILYWVGGSGDWSDPNHWAVSSGGVGGICIPTPYDDVVFDHNSFTALNQTVNIDVDYAYCHDMTWTTGVDPFLPQLNGTSSNKLNIYSSLVLAASMDMDFDGNVFFEAVTSGKTITSNGNYFKRYVTLNGVGGSWSLLDDFSSMVLSVIHGSFFSNGHAIWCYAFDSYSTNLRSIDLGSSEITIISGYSAWNVRSPNLTFNAGTSHIRFTGTYSGNATSMNQSDGLTFHNVEFTNPSKRGEFLYMTGAHFNKLIFRGDGIIRGEHTFDTLVFSSGKWYLLEDNLTQTINNEFFINGNGCYPITIQSLNSGVQAYISKPTGTVAGDYLEIRDINVGGGATFYAGEHSSDMGNNTGWIFSNAPNYVFGLPNDTIICVGDTIVLTTDDFFGGSSYLWSDGSTDSVLIVTDPGTYWVQVTYPNNCFIADTINIELCPDSIFLSFNFAHESCFGNNDGWIAVHASGSTSPYTYSWSNGAVGDSIYGLAHGVYTVTVTSITGFSAVDSLEIDYIIPATQVYAGNDTAVCSYTSLLITNATASGYSHLNWSSTGTGSFVGGTTLNPEYIPSASDIAASNVMLILTASGIPPCADASDTILLNFLPLPNLNAGNDTSICYGDLINLIASGGHSYTWATGQTTAMISVSPLTTTTYTVSAYDTHNCSASDEVVVTVHPLPHADAGHDTQICEGTSTQLNASGGINYLWSPPDGLDDINIPNPIATPINTITYAVMIEDINGCTASDEVVVQILTFSFDPGQGGSICMGGSFQLQSDSNVYCTWTPAASLNNPNIYNPVATPTATTTYYVTAYIPSDNLIFNSDFSLGNTGFSTDYIYSSSLQEGDYYIATNPNDHHSSFASCGDNTTGSGNMMIVNGSHISGQTVWCQTVSVMPHTYYAFSTWAASVHPSSPAILQFSINDVMLGTPFYLPSFPCAWQQFFEVWYSGSDTTAVICIINQNTAFSGNDFALDDLAFSVVCQATDSVKVVVENIYSLGNYYLICSGDSIVWHGQSYTSAGFHFDTLQTIHGCDSIWFIHLSLFNSYEFIETEIICSGDTLTWRGQNYYNSGIYYDSLLTVNGCDSIYVLNLTVSGNLLPQISGPNTICQGDTVVLIATGGDFYEWSDGSQTQTIIVSPANNTSFTVTITNTAGCYDTANFHISVNPLPIAGAGLPQSMCFNDSVSLQSSGGNTFLWNIGDTTATIVVSPQISTNYTVTVFNTYGCMDSASVMVTVYPLPNADAGADTLICQGTPLQFSGSGGITYSWSPSQYLNATNIANPIATPQSNITYTLTVTDSMGCTNIDQIAINFLPNPVVSLHPTSFFGCPPLTVQFSDSSYDNITHWLWNFGDPASGNNTSNQQNPVFTYQNPGVYTVSLSVTNTEGCQNAAIANSAITVYHNPVADFYATPPKTDISNPHISFFDTSSDAVSWYWDFGNFYSNQNNSIHQNPSHTYSEEGTYTVTLMVVSNEGCVDSTSNIIIIEPHFNFYIPNAFSPNGDGINDYFGGYGAGFTDYHMYIFSRWGDLVYETDDYNKPWNGKYRNETNINAHWVFVYKIEVTDFSGEKHVYIGHVTLLK